MTPGSWLKQGLRALVRGYQLLFSHWVNAGCRYHPSCSHYALEALDRHGGLAGTYLATRRILRCHPFCLGGHDPVPDQAPRLFSRLGKPTSSTLSSPPSP
ncbi:membrane protein insertion efficiency factor YidD [Inhella gelatinilytica]|uniref:Putative membrane protein insertion efficiency factor n=1 Tax=Inhella gelatinilytica TaxID=2795030 RepID=A0A931IW79_9BURK|nr:membrane protein insertion efficiency factor YidD [Inhella gelatinilytica]MBH9551758.1 membrane protein insertion efficiency factor YidD [Inhella gelatinilytica]